MNDQEINIFLKELKKFWIENEVPNVSEVNAKFLKDLIKITKSSKILEIWTANWYSTINLALAASEFDGEVTSIEFSILSHNQAKENIEKVGLSKYCKLVHANAIDFIPTLEDEYFDFIFIDWMKKRSKDFLQLSYSKIKKWCVIIIDDVIKFKDKMQSLYDYLEEIKMPHNIIPIDIDDGIMMIIKE